MSEELQQIIMMMIADSGDSISCSMAACQAASKGDFEEAEANLKSADEAITRAHRTHTELLIKEANNSNEVTFSLLLVHASNHLTNAEISYNFAEQLIVLYKEVKHV